MPPDTFTHLLTQPRPRGQHPRVVSGRQMTGSGLFKRLRCVIDRQIASDSLKVALKVLKPELAAVVGAARFLAEIKTTANLQHPHILPLFDSGEADSFLFYVMLHVEGESLRERIDRCWPRSDNRVSTATGPQRRKTPVKTAKKTAIRNLSTTMGHSTGLIREQCPVW